MGLIYVLKYILIRPCVRLRLIGVQQSMSARLHYFGELNHQAALRLKVWNADVLCIGLMLFVVDVLDCAMLTVAVAHPTCLVL